MLAMQPPPPPHAFHQDQNPMPPPRYSIMVNLPSIHVSQTTKQPPLRRPLDRKSTLLNANRNSWDTMARSTPRQSYTSDSYLLLAEPISQSSSPASPKRSRLSRFFSISKPSTPPLPTPEHEEFLLSIKCQTCTAKNQHCKFQHPWTSRYGRKAYQLVPRPALDASPAAQVERQKEKIKAKLEGRRPASLEERVLYVELCSWTSWRDAHAALGRWLKNLDAEEHTMEDLVREVVDAGGLVEELRRVGVSVSWDAPKGKIVF